VTASRPAWRRCAWTTAGSATTTSDTAARSALLVDLVRAGRLTDEPDSIGVDPAPTGFAPADRLLAAMEVEPERPLPWWIDHGGVRLDDVADACVEAGRWTVDRRLLGRRFEVVASGLDESGPDDKAPETAVVAVLATASGARGHRPEPVSDVDLAATGPLGWICETVTTHLEQRQRYNLRSAGAADGGTVPYY
jgi:hypothetical protein